jgi:DNA-binding CsgD family transcriptional regulator
MTEPDETATRDAVRRAHDADPEPLGYDVDAGLTDVYARAAEPPFGLTRRQFEVAQLAAAGLTDRQIAVLLSLSRLAVLAHLRKVYEKLDVTTSADIGRALALHARHH